jgi:hypothetical protein
MLYFLHIPKTAGISLKSILAEYFPLSEVLQFEFQPEVLYLSPVALRKYRLVMGHCTFGLMEYIGTPFEVITFLRKPLDQAISMFFDLKENGRLERDITLRDVIHSELVQSLINIQCRWLASDDIAGENLGYAPYYSTRREAVEALTDASLFAAAADRLKSLRFVGITERFGESVDILCDEFAWPRTTRLVRFNARPKKNWKDVDEKSLRELTELLEPDRRLYDLGLSLFEQERDRNRRVTTGSYQRALSESPRVEELHICCEEEVRGTGWQEREPSCGGRWARWSGPTTRSTIELPLRQDRDVSLSFLLEAVITETGYEDLRILANGVELETRHYFLKSGRYEDAVFHAVIPADILRRQSGYTTIEFLAKEVRQPLDITIDDRWLGVKINWLSVSTVEECLHRSNDIAPAQAAVATRI